MSNADLEYKHCELCNQDIHITDYFFHCVTQHPGYVTVSSLLIPQDDIQTYFDNIYEMTVNYLLDHDLLNYEGIQRICDIVGYEKTGIEDIDRVTTKKDKNLIDPEDECSICMDLLIEKEVLSINKCKHAFCRDCLKLWLEEKKQCPMCKQDIEEEEENQIV